MPHDLPYKQKMDFRWDDWNEDHIAGHNVSPEEAEYVVDHRRRPYPRELADAKFMVRGQTAAGYWLQVIYIIEEDGVAFVIHARPLTENEKKRERKHRR